MVENIYDKIGNFIALKVFLFALLFPILAVFLALLNTRHQSDSFIFWRPTDECLCGRSFGGFLRPVKLANVVWLGRTGCPIWRCTDPFLVPERGKHKVSLQEWSRAPSPPRSGGFG
ncbi:MAG: hypothetical protein RBS53_01710 [Bacteroidales bacterium]|nr:hypothetical protein [Bacteroidales bacterium]NLM93252.1 hypothetical protein [Bacteroidales bacterium]